MHLVFWLKGGRIGSVPASVATLFNAARAMRRAGIRLSVIQRDISGTVHFNCSKR